MNPILSKTNIFFVKELERDAANKKEDLLRHARNGDIELRDRVDLARRVCILHARAAALSEERVQVFEYTKSTVYNN